MNFNEDQLEAINFYKGCCNVIASAGSGKTGVIVNRIKKLIEEYKVSPDNILAITFSKKAKENIMSRLQNLLPHQYQNINIETFHSLGYKIISGYSSCKYDLITYDWRKKQILNDIYKRKYNEEITDINDVIRYISIRKNNLINPKQSNKKFVLDKEMDYLYQEYEKEKQLYNIIDYDDMLVKAYQFLSSNDVLLQKYQDQYQYVLVDEVQDINKAQYELIKILCKTNKNLFVVGDMLQNIFEWRGSSNQYIINFKKEWDNTKIINLSTNYRSSKDIVDFSNNFAKSIPESQTDNYKESISNKGLFKKPKWILYKDEFDESEKISKAINELVASESYSYKDIAILARTNAQLQCFESVLFNNGIPYQIIDGQTFVDRTENKIIISYLKLANNLNDNESFEYVYNKPNRWLGKQFLNEVKFNANKNHMSLYCAMFKIDRRNWRFKKGIDEICSAINVLRDKDFKNVGQQINYLRQKLDIDKFVKSDISDDADSDQTENLDSLEQMASKFNSLNDFLKYIASLNQKKQSDNILLDHVQLMTIHKSKGLEFPVVFLVGLSDGVLPHYRNDNINEEMRLAYVAITRAEKELYCSSVKSLYRKKKEISCFKEIMFN